MKSFMQLFPEVLFPKFFFLKQVSLLAVGAFWKRGPIP